MTKYSILDNLIKNGSVTIFSKTTCPYCSYSKQSLSKLGVKYLLKEIDLEPLSKEDHQRLNNLAGITTVPKIFIGKNCIGGNSDLQEYIRTKEIFDLLKEEGIEYKI